MEKRHTEEFEPIPPAEETPVEGTPAEETPAEDAPAEEFQLHFDEDAFDREEILSPDEQPLHKEKKRRKKKKRGGPMKIVFYTFSVIGVSVLLAAMIWTGFNDVFAFNKSSQVISVEIERGSTTKEIAKVLKENGLIEFELLFQFVSKMSENDGTYQYGIYNLRPDMGYETLMSELQKNAPKKDVLEITVVEGMTLREIGALLEENGICEANAFVTAINDAAYGYRFEDHLEEVPMKFNRMEGYAFPDTYQFYLDEEPEAVAKKFLQNFNNKITADLYGRMKDLEWSLEKTITLASLIQAESGQGNQMRKVSSVFWNRLDHPADYPRLQSDVTIFYVEENIKPYIATPNQAQYDAYNTYVCKGLPIGPICNPGLAAIKAALYPEDTGYYYFVTDAEGEFYYAKTLAQHQKNCQKAGVNASR